MALNSAHVLGLVASCTRVSDLFPLSPTYIDLISSPRLSLRSRHAVSYGSSSATRFLRVFTSLTSAAICLSFSASPGMMTLLRIMGGVDLFFLSNCHCFCRQVFEQNFLALLPGICSTSLPQKVCPHLLITQTYRLKL